MKKMMKLPTRKRFILSILFLWARIQGFNGNDPNTHLINAETTMNTDHTDSSVPFFVYLAYD